MSKIIEKEITIPENTIEIELKDFNEYVTNSQLILEEQEVLDLIEKSIKSTTARGGFVVYNDIFFNDEKGFLIIDEVTLHLYKKVYKFLKNSDSIAILISTAGEGISDLIRYYNSKGDFLRAYIVDLIGTIYVEKVADYVHNQIKEQLNANITNRYSPGYCNWPTSDQYNLFELLPKNFCGVTLNESGIMIPLKSISAIVGIGEGVRYVNYDCSFCKDKNCIYRRRPVAE